MEDRVSASSFLYQRVYTSEGSHTADPELEGIRANLRGILVENQIDLVLSGHAHCFEWVASKKKEEENIYYIVSGGGGRKLRKSIFEVSEHDDDLASQKRRQFDDLAESRAYAAKGHSTSSNDKFDNVYHYVRIDVADNPDQLIVTPVGVATDDDDKKFTRLPLMPVKEIIGYPAWSTSVRFDVVDSKGLKVHLTVTV